jgi:hypothetical protein
MTKKDFTAVTSGLAYAYPKARGKFETNDQFDAKRAQWHLTVAHISAHLNALQPVNSRKFLNAIFKATDKR